LGLIWRPVNYDNFNEEIKTSSYYPYYIVKRLCDGCVGSHREIYYKRKLTNKHWLDAAKMFGCNWTSDQNQLHIDFDLYSRIGDAMNSTNEWQWCNYDDPGIGFPRDCGPTGQVVYQWNCMDGCTPAKASCKGSAQKVTYYVGTYK